MPYKNNEELSEDLKTILPPHAQDIYREAFNSAYKQYVEGKNQSEGHAHAVAWHAVEQKYKKNPGTGMWEEK